MIKTMERRKLTGKWYLRRRKYWPYGFDVMVEVEITDVSPFDFTPDLPYKRSEMAKPEDLLELNIPCVYH